jgi:putative mRNA 3-end processing factor
MLSLRSEGLYCAQGDFYIDPWKPVARAVVTHAHADHARRGMGSYLAPFFSKNVLKLRLGKHIRLDTLPFGQKHYIRGLSLSFHPAGHIPGSAQIRLEYRGEVWVVSGDYKTTPDGLSHPFEPLTCHTFITESTFGMPLFQFPTQETVFSEMEAWYRRCSGAGELPVVLAYSLGKAQRVMLGLHQRGIPVALHSSVWETHEALRKNGFGLPPAPKWYARHVPERMPVLIAPPGAVRGAGFLRKQPHQLAAASGWMHLKGLRRRAGYEMGFVLSDHADWNGLLYAIQETKAEQVWITHGYSDVLSRFLREQGIQAQTLETHFGQTDDDSE